jgi:hypothetical protein
MKHLIVATILALAAACPALLAATPAAAQVVYQLQPDGTILATPLNGGPSWIIVPAPGTAPAYPTYGPRVQQPYFNPNSPYPPKSYFDQYRRGGSAGCVYGCAGDD